MLVTQLPSLTHDSCLCLRLESLLSLNLIKFTAAPPPKYSDRVRAEFMSRASQFRRQGL